MTHVRRLVHGLLAPFPFPCSLLQGLIRQINRFVNFRTRNRQRRNDPKRLDATAEKEMHASPPATVREIIGSFFHLRRILNHEI
jgi:hypothetical protein